MPARVEPTRLLKPASHTHKPEGEQNQGGRCAMTEREAGELLTIREIARKFGVRDHQVRYGAELVDVEPDRRIGNTGLFGPDAIARIRTALVCTRAIQSPELAAARRGRSRKRVAG